MHLWWLKTLVGKLKFVHVSVICSGKLACRSVLILISLMNYFKVHVTITTTILCYYSVRTITVSQFFHCFAMAECYAWWASYSSNSKLSLSIFSNQFTEHFINMNLDFTVNWTLFRNQEPLFFGIELEPSIQYKKNIMDSKQRITKLKNIS